LGPTGPGGPDQDIWLYRSQNDTHDGGLLTFGTGSSGVRMNDSIPLGFGSSSDFSWSFDGTDTLNSTASADFVLDFSHKVNIEGNGSSRLDVTNTSASGSAIVAKGSGAAATLEMITEGSSHYPLWFSWETRGNQAGAIRLLGDREIEIACTKSGSPTSITITGDGTNGSNHTTNLDGDVIMRAGSLLVESAGDIIIEGGDIKMRGQASDGLNRGGAIRMEEQGEGPFISHPATAARTGYSPFQIAGDGECGVLETITGYTGEFSRPAWSLWFSWNAVSTRVGSVRLENDHTVKFNVDHPGGTTDERLMFTSGAGAWSSGTLNTPVTGNDDLTVEVYGTLKASLDVIVTSDRRFKRDIETVDGSKVLDMRGATFIKQRDEDARAIRATGVIAQEMQEIAPEVVYEMDSEGHLGVSYDQLSGYFIEAIKMLNNKIETLEAEVKKLKGD
jgi:hypothetical protein